MEGPLKIESPSVLPFGICSLFKSLLFTRQITELSLVWDIYSRKWQLFYLISGLARDPVRFSTRGLQRWGWLGWVSWDRRVGVDKDLGEWREVGCIQSYFFGLQGNQPLVITPSCFTQSIYLFTQQVPVKNLLDISICPMLWEYWDNKRNPHHDFILW